MSRCAARRRLKYGSLRELLAHPERVPPDHEQAVEGIFQRKDKCPVLDQSPVDEEIEALVAATAEHGDVVVMGPRAVPHLDGVRGGHAVSLRRERSSPRAATPAPTPTAQDAPAKTGATGTTASAAERAAPLHRRRRKRRFAAQHAHQKRQAGKPQNDVEQQPAEPGNPARERRGSR